MFAIFSIRFNPSARSLADFFKEDWFFLTASVTSVSVAINFFTTLWNIVVMDSAAAVASEISLFISLITLVNLVPDKSSFLIRSCTAALENNGPFLSIITGINAFSATAGKPSNIFLYNGESSFFISFSTDRNRPSSVSA